MNRKQTGRYDAYNLTYGNRPELFGAGSPTYSGGTTGSIGTGGGTGGSGGVSSMIFHRKPFRMKSSQG